MRVHTLVKTQRTINYSRDLLSSFCLLVCPKSLRNYPALLTVVYEYLEYHKTNNIHGKMPAAGEKFWMSV